MSEQGLLYELALLSVVLGGGYWGWYFTTRQPHGTPTYGLMQLACAALSGLGLIGHRAGFAWMGVAGAIGVGGGTCLLLVGPLVRSAARRFAGLEQFGIASKLLSVADLLAPGAGAADERALLGAMREIRDGKIQPTVDALTAAKQSAPAEAKLAIDERIAMLYLAAYRWDDAIAHAEGHLFGAVPPRTSSERSGLAGELGVAPPVFVELLGAYGRTGNLDQAARMLARLEEVCADRTDAGVWLHRGRLMFLALAGRVAAVQALVEPRRSRHMNPSARTYWLAVAHERHGETKAAEAAYAKARSGTRGRPREMIDQALANLMNAKVAELTPITNEVIARVEAAPAPDVAAIARSRGPWATRALTSTIALVALVIVVFIGPSTDLGVVMRGGALVRGVVRGGETWRLVSALFVHIGAVHLIMNLIGLLFIGRLAEDLFGPWRTLAIFAVAGIAGSVASYYASPAGVSAGASGAIFGLLGAIFVELTWHRRKHRAAWSRGLWGAVVVAIGQIGLLFMYPIMDQWAHGGGLIAGALSAFVLTPRVAKVVAFTFAAIALACAVMVARTSISESLARAPFVQSDNELVEPDLFIVRATERVTTQSFPEQLASYIAGEPARAKDRHFDQIAEVHDRIIPLPPGWEGSELSVTVTEAFGAPARYRVVIAGKATDRDTVLVSLYLPETVGRQAPEFFTKLLASAE